MLLKLTHLSRVRYNVLDIAGPLVVKDCGFAVFAHLQAALIGTIGARQWLFRVIVHNSFLITCEESELERFCFDQGRALVQISTVQSERISITMMWANFVIDSFKVSFLSTSTNFWRQTRASHWIYAALFSLLVQNLIKSRRFGLELNVRWVVVLACRNIS